LSPRRWACRSASPFFGLTPDDKIFFLEPVFTLMYYMGFTYTEAMSLPIWQRRWFIERVIEEMKAAQGASKAAHSNDHQSRSLRGVSRGQVPAKLRRFT